MRTEPPPESNPEFVQTTDYYHHVRVRAKDVFSEFRTPQAATDTPSVDVDGCDVRMGRTGPDQWLVESVLVPVEAALDEEAAERHARRVVDHVENG
jgi:hypothetical protein